MMYELRFGFMNWCKFQTLVSLVKSVTKLHPLFDAT